jgi:hypothetical protein
MFGTKQKTVDTSNLAIASSLGIVEADDQELDVSGGRGSSSYSDKGYSRDRNKTTIKSFVGPEGSYSEMTTQSESIDTFARDGASEWE